MLSKVSIYRNPLYYIVFGNKHIGVNDTQKHLNKFKPLLLSKTSL